MMLSLIWGHVDSCRMLTVGAADRDFRESRNIIFYIFKFHTLELATILDFAPIVTHGSSGCAGVALGSRTPVMVEPSHSRVGSLSDPGEE